MSDSKTHRMVMAPHGGSGGGPPKDKKPSGTGYPAVGPGRPTADTPIPVVLTQRTLFKLIAGIVGPLLLVASGAAYFFYATTTHISDKSLHLDRMERPNLQTKAGCSTNAKKIATEIKREVRLYHRAAVVQQKEEIQQVGQKLEAQQREGLRRILRELKQGNRATRRAIRATPTARRSN